MAAERLTPRQRVDKFLEDIGLAYLDIQQALAHIWGFPGRFLPEGRWEETLEDAFRLEFVICGGDCSEFLTEEQLAELEELRPTLQEIGREMHKRLYGLDRPRKNANAEPAPKKLAVRRTFRQHGARHRRAPGARPVRRGGSRRATGTSASRDDPPDESDSARLSPLLLGAGG